MNSKLHYRIQNLLFNEWEWVCNDLGCKSVEKIRSDLAKVGPLIESKLIVSENEYVTTLKGGIDPLVRTAGDSAIQFYFPQYKYSGPNVYAISRYMLGCFSKISNFSRPFDGLLKDGEAVVEVWNTSPVKDMYKEQAVVQKEFLVLGFSSEELYMSARRLALMCVLSDTELCFDRSAFHEVLLRSISIFGGGAQEACEWLFKHCIGLGRRPCDCDPKEVLEFFNRLEHGSML